MTRFDYDWLVIGSGFGGSVSALRLAENGDRVGILECGRRFRDRDFARTTWQLTRDFWLPHLGFRGVLRLTPFNDSFIASGCGGSLGYANTLYFRRTRVGAFFGESGKTVSDPYFGGEGPERTGCIR